MKNSLFTRFILFLLVPVLCLGTFCLASAGLNQSIDQVEYTEKHIIGDVSAAEGLEILLRTEYQGNLHWETILHPGPEPETRSTFEYTADNVQNFSPTRSRVELNTAFTLGYSSSPEHPDRHGFAKAYETLIAEAPNGQKTECTVRIADYFDYYPLSGIMVFPGEQHIYFNEATDNGAAPSSNPGADIRGSETYITDRMEDFFRIPVSEDETLRIHITKDENGHVTTTGGGSSNQENYSMRSDSVFTGEEAYFTFNTRTTWSGQKSVPVDTSLIPGGYGIYRIPYTTETSQYAESLNSYTTRMHRIYGIDADSMEMVYSLDPAVYLLDLEISQNQEMLFLHTRENISGTDCYVTTIIEESTMDTLQRLETPYPENNTGDCLVYHGEDFFVTILNSQYLYLYTADSADGSYRLAFTGSLYLEEIDDIMFWPYETDFLKMDYNPKTGRLAICFIMDENPSRTSFHLAVYQPEGLAYYGQYYSSLGARPLNLSEEGYDRFSDMYSYPVNDGDDICSPASGDALTVCWQQAS